MKRDDLEQSQKRLEPDCSFVGRVDLKFFLTVAGVITLIVAALVAICVWSERCPQ